MTEGAVLPRRTTDRVKVTEIFHSIQGESSDVGRPCVFIRLSGCNLRCSWCDSAYSFVEGDWYSTGTVLERIAEFGTKYVLITGGEPLAQDGVHALIEVLLREEYEVAIETGGSLDISPIDRRVRVVMDLKCPGSGMHAANRWENLRFLKPGDEIKFVIADRADYEWARSAIHQHRLQEVCKLLVSPVHGVLEPRSLAEWVLADRLPVRLQLQIQKFIWPLETRGV